MHGSFKDRPHVARTVIPDPSNEDFVERCSLVKTCKNSGVSVLV